MQQKIARGAQHTSRLCTAHTRELVKKGFQRLIVFEKLEQKLNRHSCSTKNSDPTHFLGITFNKLLGIHCTVYPRVRRSRGPASADSTWPPPHQVLKQIFYLRFSRDALRWHSSLTINLAQCAAQAPTVTSDEHRRRA